MSSLEEYGLCPCLQEGARTETRNFCENCKAYICAYCEALHQTYQDLRNHTIVPSKKQQHDDSSGPSDLTTPLSQLSTQPSEKSNAQRGRSEAEDVTKDFSCEASNSISEMQTISITTPDEPGDSKEAAMIDHEFQKGMNVLKDVNFHLATKVNIRGLDDKHQPTISGCCFMPGGEILVSEYWGRKVKLFDSSFKLKGVLEYLPGGPSGVAALDKATAVVIVGYQIQFINVLPSLKMGRSITVDKYCHCIDIAADKIYVCCYTPGKDDGEIRIYDFEGKSKKTFSYMFKQPKYVSVSRSDGKIFVLDDTTIKCLTAEGTLHFQSKELRLAPEGIYADDYGDVLVCKYLDNTIVLITERGREYRTLLSSRDSINKPNCITYRPEDGTLMVGCINSPLLLVYQASFDDSAD